MSSGSTSDEDDDHEGNDKNNDKQCPYYPRYPDLSGKEKITCSVISVCCNNYPTNAKDACCVNNLIWLVR